MSQKNAKRLRRLEDRVDWLEVGNDMLDRRQEQLETDVHKLSADQITSDRFRNSLDAVDAMYRREADEKLCDLRRAVRQEQRTASIWKSVAYGALTAAVVIEVIAILTIHANSAEKPATQAEDSPSSAHTVSIIPPTETPEEPENELIEAALLGKAHVLENATISHYDCCVACCGKDDGITASGVRATPGVTVAVDPAIIPLGSDVLVDYGDGEIHYYRADDVGGSITGSHIDLCVEDHDTAENLGIRTATVYWVEPEGAKTIWQ